MEKEPKTKMTRLTTEQLQSLLAGCEGADEVLLVRLGMSAFVPTDVFVSAVTELLELRKALEPFAAFKHGCSAKASDDAVAVETGWISVPNHSLTVGDFRRAARALNPKAPK